MIWSCIFFFIIKGSSVVIGMLLYANYHDCDPIATKVRTKVLLRNSLIYIIGMLLYANYLAWLGTGEGSNNFPSQLKYSEIGTVKPYSKKVDKENSGNYRPIPILISFSRVFDKFAFSQLAKFFLTTTFLISSGLINTTSISIWVL